MPMPEDKPKKSAVDRFRNILSAAVQKKEETGEARKASVTNLPKAKTVTTTVRQTAATVPAKPAAPRAPLLRKEQLLPAFWTFASVVSILFNAVLLAVLIGVLRGVGGMNATGFGSGLLGGFYSNFERMDQAHIKTSIPIQSSIPLNMNIPVQTTTGITLAQDVVIHNAHVKISTATFNIDSAADVTLPAGTPLNVVLNFSVPVQTAVPVNMNVPVDIPLKDTELHPAILGLQDTIKPLYCIVNPAAVSTSGTVICH